MPEIDRLEVRLLELIRDATAAGIIRWEATKRNPDLYTAKNTPLRFRNCHIRFKWPAYNGDDGSDRDFVEVDQVGRFMIGTPGWELALAILAAAFPSWADHQEMGSAGYSDNIKRVSAALAKQGRKTRKSVTAPRSRKPRTAPRSA